MLGRVGERLRDGEVRHRLHRRRDGAERADLQVRVDRRPGGQRGQRTGESAIGEDRRVDRPDHRPQFGHRVLGALLRLRQQLRHQLRLLVQQFAGHAEPHRDRHQPGLRAVVQVPFDAAQFGAVRVHRVGPGLGQRRHLPGQPFRRRRRQQRRAQPGVLTRQQGHRPVRGRGERRQLRRPRRQRAAPPGQRYAPAEAARPGAGRQRPPQRDRHGRGHRVARAQHRERTARQAAGGARDQPGRHPPPADRDRPGRLRLPQPFGAGTLPTGPATSGTRDEQHRQRDQGGHGRRERGQQVPEAAPRGRPAVVSEVFHSGKSEPSSPGPALQQAAPFSHQPGVPTGHRGHA
ncbi:hypothetical protein KCH_08880 [Kitasatospora cheerisanensis KCTC 2395]|uniref:Uncharacterized protein n=1 Tax=Kitasatospora cheerisanensis KCTC 2395 TaxID=1348663 RepID=A0A066Z531_9ACTN|nr:hypothetical protein KCH_08880 [Kitasatospora cheerisanensis KCTC 2395]